MGVTSPRRTELKISSACPISGPQNVELPEGLRTNPCSPPMVSRQATVLLVSTAHVPWPYDTFCPTASRDPLLVGPVTYRHSLRRSNATVDASSRHCRGWAPPRRPHNRQTSGSPLRDSPRTTPWLFREWLIVDLHTEVDLVALYFCDSEGQTGFLTGFAHHASLGSAHGRVKRPIAYDRIHLAPELSVETLCRDLGSLFFRNLSYR